MLNLTLLMLTKNEENKVQHALKSVLNIVSDIVIVDTGSTDKTIEKIREIAPNARIYGHEFTNFSDLLNYGLLFCNTDWVLFLDADEAILPAAEPLIKELISKKDYDVWQIPRKHWKDLEMKEWYKAVHWYPNYAQKLFKKGLRFEGYVHPKLVSYKKLGTVKNGFHIHHFNLYYDTPETMWEKQRLYVQLEEQEKKDKKI